LPPAGASPARYNILAFSGTLTADHVIIVPNLQKSWIIWNATTGSAGIGGASDFTLKIKTPSGSAILIPQGVYNIVSLTGNIGARIGARSGEIIQHGGSTPNGFIFCDGRALSRTKYNELFGQINTIWGVGDGSTTFNIPNFTTTSRFLRCAGGLASIGQLQSNCIVDHTHTGSVTISANTGTESAAHNHGIIGSTSGADRSLDHTHTVTAMQQITTAVISGGGAFLGGNTTITSSGSSGGTLDHLHSINFTSQNENQAHFHFFTGTGSFTTSGATGGNLGSEVRPEAGAVYFHIGL
jgi:microcystin-dependent protein